ncbi:MAG: hypothetical protein ACLFWL_06825 [Candidatus Brocadiia bacterium]
MDKTNGKFQPTKWDRMDYVKKSDRDVWELCIKPMKNPSTALSPLKSSPPTFPENGNTRKGFCVRLVRPLNSIPRNSSRNTLPMAEINRKSLYRLPYWQ